MQPTIGRIVHFFRKIDPIKKAQAALVVAVHPHEQVNLVVWGANGSMGTEMFVPLVPEKGVPPDSNYCMWPPRS